MSSLSTEQMLILNNLMYMNGSDPFPSFYGNSGRTIGEVINQIDTSRISEKEDYSFFTSGKEWNEIISAVKADPKLMDTRIVQTHIDGKGANSILFANSSEAVVVFQGTASAEWKDNFTGGAGTTHLDGVSTDQQQAALDWFQSLDLDGYDSVTVSGHSKGGNKAKYITIMSDSVDHCVSFDGQGFSDEFVDKYQGRIAANQSKISNHNASGDYVNILLNDVGERHYYKEYNVGEGKLAENHCPNTMMRVDKYGNVWMDETTQNPDLQKVDGFLNSYLRTLPDKDRRATMDVVGDIAQIAFTGGSGQEIVDVLTSGDNKETAASLLAYVIKYEQTDPEFAEALKGILRGLGMEGVSGLVDWVTGFMNSRWFAVALGAADWASDKVPDWALDKLRDYIKENMDIDLSREDLRKLLSVLRSVNQRLPVIKVDLNSGEDRQIASTGGRASFDISVTAAGRAASNVQTCAGKLHRIHDKISNVMDELEGVNTAVRPALRTQVNLITKSEASVRSMGNALGEIVEMYSRTDAEIAGK